ncbi:MAG: helix-turn-helix transcriptional regulator [Anaerolineaceae bacterium]|nr:helix-turn-helix transcriptional regulator [Anaerolineaceae bacterium]
MTTIVVIGKSTQISVLHTGIPVNQLLQKLNTKNISGFSELDDLLTMQNFFQNKRNWHCLATGKDRIVVYYETLNQIGKKEYANKPHLSFRQHQVLHYLCQGFTTRQIAASLQIHPSTVSFHIRYLKDALQVNSRAEIAGKAAAYGLFTPGSKPPHQNNVRL